MSKRSRSKNQNTNWMELWIGLFIALYLLFPGFSGYSAITGAKVPLFYTLSGLLLILGVVLLLRDRKKGEKRGPGPAQIAALLFGFFTLISAAFSPAEGGNPWYDGAAHEAALTVSLYVLLFLIISRWGMPTERLFRVLFWSVAAFAAVCLLQIPGWNPLRLYPKNLNFYDGYGVKYKGAYAGTIGNVDIVSAFLTLAVPMLLLHTRGQKPKEAWPCWLLTGLCLGIMFWIRVLCGLVGLVLGGGICLAVLCPDKQRKWILLLLAALGALALAVLWLCDLPVGMLHELHEILHGRFDDSFGTGRFYIWRQMLARIPDRLWLGVGPDMARYSGLSPFVRYDETGAAVARAAITDAHCYPLHILYCQGLPALLSWLTVVGITLAHWIRHRRDRAVSILGAGLICFLCAMLFCLSSIIVMPFFWLTMGLLEARARQQKV
ncbi:MAG: O-antigen ligase family protein [Oscillospiraceae bacterium]|nr:O-antigen ligase family protein [Oscillospiraceae bacterium]